jgi:hypothetical protein
MKKISMALLMLISLGSLTSCHKVIGKGPSVTENRIIADFSQVEMGVPGHLYYTPGTQFKVEITGQQNILDIIETEVKGDMLRVKFKDGRSISRHDGVTVKVTAPDLTGLGVNGSGNLHADPFQPSSATLWVNGSGELTVNKVNTAFLEGRISGSGEIKVFGGSATDVKLSISGSGEIEAAGLDAENVTTTTSGSGDMEVKASKLLDCKISGSGDVRYKGSPRVSTSISGSGRVTAI